MNEFIRIRLFYCSGNGYLPIHVENPFNFNDNI